ncbi:MAG: nitroreductase family protein [Spirochaetes bacterium]|nr:nitroreductase family protein [Spirochaetota bacterium]
MTFLELAQKRESVREYRPDTVSRKDIDHCLEAARIAPSACNSQPWRFIVIDDPEFKTRVAQAAFSGVHAVTGRFVISAPVLIVMITERSKYIARVGGALKNVQYSLIDIGIAAEHICLAARERGLGTCMLGWFNDTALKKTLQLPRSASVDLVITLGLPATAGTREKKRKTLDEIRIYNK